MRLALRAALCALVSAAIARLAHATSPVDLRSVLEPLSAFLHVYGAIYGTLLAFLIFVVWNQFVAAEAGLAREARALQELAALCRAGRRDGCEEVLEAIRNYARIAVGSEWKGLAEGKAVPAADQAFLAIQTAVLRSGASTEIELLARDTIIRVSERAAALRAERIAVSITRIPPTLWATLVFASGLLCLSIGLLAADPLSSTYLTAGMTLVVVLLLGVIADMDNPFDGVFNAARAPMEALKFL